MEESFPEKRSRAFNHLVLSRIFDQGTMALASLALARIAGPAAFAPVAVLLVVNSLAVQISDFGLGFAVLRGPSSERLALGALRRLRLLSLGVLATATVVGLSVGGTAGVTIGCGGWVWALSAESYVRKAVALRAGSSRAVAVAEVAGAAVIVTAVAVVWQLDASPVWFAVGLVAKHATEVFLLGGVRDGFSPSGRPARSGFEWLGQVVTYAVANVDYLVVALVLTPVELSTYVIAFRVASAFPALLGGPITTTAFVELASAPPAERGQVRNGIVRRSRLVGVAGGLAVLLAAPLLPIILGSSWAGTGWLVAILAPAVPFRLVLGPSVANAITLGAARHVVWWESGRLVAVALAAWLGAAVGLVPATGAVAATTIVSVATVHRLSGSLAGDPGRRADWLWAGVAIAGVALLVWLAWTFSP